MVEQLLCPLLVVFAIDIVWRFLLGLFGRVRSSVGEVGD